MIKLYYYNYNISLYINVVMPKTGIYIYIIIMRTLILNKEISLSKVFITILIANILASQCKNTL